MSRRRRMRDIEEFSTGEFVPGHRPIEIVRTPVHLPDVNDDPCRACLARGEEVPGVQLVRGSWFCAADALVYAPILDGLPAPALIAKDRFCARCCEPMTIDRERMARELALYGRMTGICSRCFDQRASDTYMPARKTS